MRYKTAIRNARTHARRRGYTVEEIKSAYAGRCHACGVPEIECASRLCMAHDHSSGEFRGWLCANCNHILGLATDSADRMRALADYVAHAEARI